MFEPEVPTGPGQVSSREYQTCGQPVNPRVDGDRATMPAGTVRA